MGLRKLQNFIALILVTTIIIIIQETKVIEGVPDNSDQSNNSNSNDKTPEGDYYTSLTGIQDLARKEQLVLKELLQYRKNLQERLDVVDFYLDDYSETIHSLIRRSKRLREKYRHTKYPKFEDEDDLEYVVESTSANPLMVFKLLRRFSRELGDLALAVTENDIERDFKTYMDELPDELNVPDKKDMKGAAEGLLRLQEVYQLPTLDMSNGRLIDKRTGCKLTAFDMRFIGICAFNDEMFATAAEWLYLAHQRTLEGDTSGDEESIVKELRLLSDRHNQEFLRFRNIPINLFSSLINSNRSNIPHLYMPPLVREQPLREIPDTMFDVYNFYALCRGETLVTPEDTKNLRCLYSRGQSAYHILNPFKVEIHSEDPPVFQIYDLLSDEVIAKLKEMARPNLKRAQVVGPNNQLIHGAGEATDVRTSAVAWLYDREFSASVKIPKMLERLTGLVCEPHSASEFLQISCYGSIGGFYTVHMDALFEKFKGDDRPEEFYRKGDRVATIMFYLSEVELGGGTAFPKIGVAAKPIKGSAVFWYNLKYNGEREPLMLHGGCPVLYGNKWVANKWIRNNDQFRTRKCKTDPLV